MRKAYEDANVEVDKLELKLPLDKLISEYIDFFTAVQDDHQLVFNGNRHTVSLEERVPPGYSQPKPSYRVTAQVYYEKDDPCKEKIVRFNSDLRDVSSTKPLVFFICHLLEKYRGTANLTVKWLDGKEQIRTENIVYVGGERSED
jgi:hypothetical protein